MVGVHLEILSHSLPAQSCLYSLYLFCLKCLKACCRVSNINKLKLHSLNTPYQNIHLNVASYNKECIHVKINFSPKELLKNAVKGFGIVFYRLINVHTNFRGFEKAILKTKYCFYNINTRCLYPWFLVCVCIFFAKLALSRVRLFATPCMVALRAPLSMEFSRQAYWSGLPIPTSRNLPNPVIRFASPVSPALAGEFFTIVPVGKIQ